MAFGGRGGALARFGSRRHLLAANTSQHPWSYFGNRPTPPWGLLCRNSHGRREPSACSSPREESSSGSSRLAVAISGNSHPSERGPAGKSEHRGPHPPWLSGEAAAVLPVRPEPCRPPRGAAPAQLRAPLRRLESVFRNTHRRAYVLPGLGRARTRALPSSNMAKEPAFCVGGRARSLLQTELSLFFLKPSPSSSPDGGQVAAMFAWRVCV